MLLEEQGTAESIKNPINKKSVLSALASTRERLKLYSHKAPNNGLVVFCGTIWQDDGKTYKLLIDFEPFKPISKFHYHCDNQFHVESLLELLEVDQTYGYIVVDGNGVLYGTLQGSSKTIIHKHSVSLPKKHGRGGQSAKRFERLCGEKRHNYVREVAELATKIFIRNDMPNVTGLILAGCGPIKYQLMKSELFDKRLKPKVIKVVDIAYGGENGFNQAIELSQECLKNVEYLLEKKILSEFFQHIATDSGKYCYGPKDTQKMLEDMKAIEHLIILEDSDIERVVRKHKETGVEEVEYMRGEDVEKFSSDQSPVEGYVIVERMNLAEWLAENYKTLGIQLTFISGDLSEGVQFSKGFGGIGGFLRYEIDSDVKEDELYIEEEDDDFM